MGITVHDGIFEQICIHKIFCLYPKAYCKIGYSRWRCCTLCDSNFETITFILNAFVLFSMLASLKYAAFVGVSVNKSYCPTISFQNSSFFVIQTNRQTCCIFINRTMNNVLTCLKIHYETALNNLYSHHCSMLLLHFLNLTLFLALILPWLFHRLDNTPTLTLPPVVMCPWALCGRLFIKVQKHIGSP